MANLPGQTSPDNQASHDRLVPHNDTRQDVPFDSLRLYQGLKEIVDTSSSPTQTAAMRNLGFPSVGFSNVDQEEHQEEGETESEHQAEQHHFTSTTSDTATIDPTVDGMINSGDEDQQRRGQRLHEMLASDNHTDNDSARAIINMLGSDDYHQVAQTMLDVFTNSDINTMVQLLNDPNRTNEADLVVGMMAGRQDLLSGAFTAQRLLGMIGSTDGDTRASGERLLSMLGNEDEAPLANTLLGLDNSAIEQFLQVYNDPNQEELASQLTGLLTSDNNSEVRAATGILSMMTSDDGSERYAGATLAEMLTDPDERDTAVTIAGALDSPQQRIQMLALLDNPAGEHLVEMLGNENQAASVVNLLNLLGSEFEVDRRDGGNLLNMLSTESRSNAERILALSDPQSVHHLTEILANPATQSAAGQLLDMIDSPQRRERAAVNTFLESMDSTNEADRDRNDRLITLLSNGNTAPSARSLMVAFRDEPSAQAAALTLLQTNPEQGRMIATMLGGTPQEKSAARTLVEMRVNERSSEVPLRRRDDGPGDRQDDRPGDGPANRPQAERQRTSDQMLQMLANQGDRPPALNILSRLDAQQSTTLMGVRATHPDAFDRLTTMLQNGQESAVRNLLQLASSPALDGRLKQLDRTGREPDLRGGATEPMQQILEMLNNPRDAQARQTAETLMTHLSTSQQFASMTRLLAAPGFQAEARQITAMLADPRRASDASTMLNNLAQPAQIRTMLNLLGDENRRNETQRLMQMLPEGTGARLLDMLGSANETTRQTGNSLLTMLGTDNVFDAQNILDAQTSPAQSQIMLNLLANRETAPAARQLLNRLGLEPSADQVGQNPVRVGATTLLGMLEQNGATGQAARQILTMLGSETESRQADAILSMGSAESMQSVVGVLNDPDRRPAAEQLRALLNSHGPGSLELQNLEALMQGGGRQLIEMLNTPAQQANANAILRRFNSPVQAQQMLQLLSREATRPVAEQLMRMIQSPQNTQTRAAENWVNVIGNPNSDTRAGINQINAMLTDPQRRDQAIAILSNLENDNQQRQLATLLSDPNNPGAEQVMQMLASGNRRQIEGARSLLDLRTQESANRRAIGDPVPASTQLLEMLANPESEERARALIAAASSPEQLQTLLQMSQNPQYADSLIRIMAAMRNPEQEQAMRTALNRINNPAQLNQMVQLMSDANYRQAAQELIGILQDDERNPFVVTNLMGMLTSTNAETRQAGRALLDILNSDDNDRARNGGDILNANLTPEAVTQMMNIMRNPALQHAASEVMDLLRDDDASARALFDMLQSTTPAVQEQGRRILSQLNSYSTAPFGRRTLETRAIRFPSKG